MSEVTKDAPVTREHREAVVRILGETGQCAAAFVADDMTLCSCNGNSYPARDKKRAARVYAELDAAAEHRGRHAILTRLRALLDRSGDHVLALDMRLLIAEMEAGNAV